MNPAGNITLRILAKIHCGAWCVFVVAMLAGCNAKSPATGSGAASKSEVAKPQAVVEADVKPQTADGDPQVERPSSDARETPEGKAEEAPEKHTAPNRADATPAKMPIVILSKREEALCKVKVGDTMPAIGLPKIGGSGTAKLGDLFGKKATVVVFWKGDRRMALEELADLGPDVSETFGKNGVAVVGIAVKESAASAPEDLTNAGAKFTNLLDADGKAFAQVGSERLPRTYLLDPSGKILWFDIEYSHATRRELHDALRVVSGAK
jgi:peroxiredoxin